MPTKIVEEKGTRREFLRRLGQVGAESTAAALPEAPVGETASPPSTAGIALSRMGFGPRPGDIEAFNALGATDEARLNAYVDQQLNPAAIVDAEYNSRLAQFGGSTLNKSLTQLWADHVRANPPWSQRMAPFFETERLAFLRALTSKKQLVEVLADFWHNHFNVLGYDYYIGPLFVHYDRDIIRANLLGNFYEMLVAVAKSPAMLYYLDNAGNRDDGPNENYARELFELHTLGAENYFGVAPQDSVPADPTDATMPAGYVDADVYEATRCFTGWTINDRDSYTPVGNTGEFYYRNDWHDRFQKRVLSGTTNIPADQAPLKDGLDVLRRLADHPGTARHIARKLCRRFISDNPPDAIVNSTAQIFYDNRNAPDQLKKVCAHILKSVEFRTTWGEKTRRPFEYVVSALRALDVKYTIRPGDSLSDSFMWSYGQAGQPLFRWQSPNGYPDVKEPWLSTAPLVMSWRVIKRFLSYEIDDVYLADVLGQTPLAINTATGLADFWIDRLLHRPLDPAQRQEIINFMAQNDGANTPLPIRQTSWPGASYRNRLRVMVVLILQTPEFHEK